MVSDKERAKRITLEIDHKKYWCPSCKTYQLFVDEGAVNSQWLVCGKGHRVCRRDIQFNTLFHRPINIK